MILWSNGVLSRDEVTLPRVCCNHSFSVLCFYSRSAVHTANAEGRDKASVFNKLGNGLSPFTLHLDSLLCVTEKLVISMSTQHVVPLASLSVLLRMSSNCKRKNLDTDKLTKKLRPHPYERRVTTTQQENDTRHISYSGGQPVK